ncbi:MAG: AAA family ATPase, partial [Lachnospiraceae bacterium]|nr:AAA family ATPase [Lachnospiraceae bacterium]
MKKQNLINLVKFHVEKNDEAFAVEVAEIAKEFDAAGDSSVAQYLMELVSNASFYIPQSNYSNMRFLRKEEYSSQPLILPDV